MNLVNWPEDTEGYPDVIGGYRDTGEGGLWGYVVWELPKTNCAVDTSPDMPMADVITDAHGPLAVELQEVRSEYRTGAYYENYYENRTRVGTAVYLGSTGASSYNDAVGSYFRVRNETLTDEGRTLVATLSALYGEPTFITYLDT